MIKQLAPRLHRWVTDYGLDYALLRAEKAMKHYRRVYLTDKEVLDKEKPSILISYLEMKEFLRTKEVDYEPETSEAHQQLLERVRGK